MNLNEGSPTLSAAKRRPGILVSGNVTMANCFVYIW